MATGKRKKSYRDKRLMLGSQSRSIAKTIALRLVIILLVIGLASLLYLDLLIKKQFEGEKWALPAHVYTRPMDIFSGQRLTLKALLDELDELGYQRQDTTEQVGSFRFNDKGIEIYQRGFRFWDGYRAAQRLKVQFEGNSVAALHVDDRPVHISRLEPRLFGSVSPMAHEDRSLVSLEQVPSTLIDALIVTEDQQFYRHFGINPAGIARAMLANLRAGRWVQGGSTLTQQLVKNYFLSSDRTLRRKFMEMIMAMLLELHYSKEEILQAYINEVHLSQAGNRAIHGFALGSLHYFGRPLAELSLAEVATLAGMIKGPSLYHPIRHPERSKERRDLVLRLMSEQGVIDEDQYQTALNSPLITSKNAENAALLSYPTFIGLVRDKLTSDYLQQDLLSAGLQIHTTLDPRIQESLEAAVVKELGNIESRYPAQAGKLQVAAVVIRADNGEVAALLGDRKATFSGFNRAIHARRPVGSLIKPFVYLSALEQPQKYSLASLLEDQPITISQRGSEDWQPENYDSEAHGETLLLDALANSYNLATVRLGTAVGIYEVLDTLYRSGFERDVMPLPSVLLGAVSMSPLEVSQLYLTLASGGFKIPINPIRSVLSAENQPLSRYALEIDQVIEPQFVYLISYALQEVVRRGTGRVVQSILSPDYQLAGKTGTTNDYRDSWFAGFSGNYVTVVWVGRDDNQPTGLTGASGAARVWARIMQKMPLYRLTLTPPSDMVSLRVANSPDEGCANSRQIPILQSSLANVTTRCETQNQNDSRRDQQSPRGEESEKKTWWQKIFG